jgi:2,4-dienoyl-CoA reductase-like NADH-dependent reductase (Old Yellow Enzyme family)
MNAYDGLPYPYGFGVSRHTRQRSSLHDNIPDVDLSEAVRLLHEMKALGVDFVNVSMGNPYYGAFITRPFDVKIPGTRDPPEHPLESVDRHFKIVEKLKKEVPDMIFVGSGYSWLRQYSLYAAAHNIENRRTDIAGWGRLALAFPAFPKTAFLKGSIPSSKVCIACSGCTRLLRAGFRTGCVIQNPDTFRESMRKLAEMGK